MPPIMSPGEVEQPLSFHSVTTRPKQKPRDFSEFSENPQVAFGYDTVRIASRVLATVLSSGFSKAGVGRRRLSSR